MTKENYCNYITCQGNCLECEFPDFVIKTLDIPDESKYILFNAYEVHKERKYASEIYKDNTI